MRTHPLRVAAVASLVLLPLAACGGGDDDEGGSGGGDAPSDADLVILALDQLKFDEASYTAEAGEISFEYVNDGSLPHTLLIDGIDNDAFKLEVTGAGAVDDGSVELEPGEYVLYCDVAGHRAAGMEATLTVE